MQRKNLHALWLFGSLALWLFGSLALWLKLNATKVIPLCLVAFNCAANGQVLLYSQNFETQNISYDNSGGIDVSLQTVNDLYGGQPAGFLFSQDFTVETLLITGGAAFGTGYKDPSQIGGNYAIGMQSGEPTPIPLVLQPDLLGLRFNVGGFKFLSFRMDISSIDISGLNGPFGSQGLVPRFRYTLYDNPTGTAGLGSGTILATQDAFGVISPRDTFDWTNIVVNLNAIGNTNGNVILRIDLIEGRYAAFDNLQVFATDIPLVPEPTTTMLGAVAGFALLLRRRRY